MKKEYYIIFIDILGFDKLAEEIGNKKEIEPRRIREYFLDVISNKVEDIEQCNLIIGKRYSESDDWTLCTDDIDKMFSIVFKVLDHDTGYRNYEKIPLQIVMGTADYDERAKLKNVKLVIEDSTIDFYKSNVIPTFHDFYKKCNGEAPRSTYVLLLESVYSKLEPLKRMGCQKIEHKFDSETKTFYNADLDKLIQNGLLYKFLEEIGLSKSKIYDGIDDIFIAPLEFEEINNILEKNRIVIISGTKEYGKTFTSIKILWDFFRKGIEPTYISGEENEDRKTIREKLRNIQKELRPRSIIYFEDPFGKTRYEKNESLEREISTILQIIKDHDSYVIISSREEIYKEFIKESASGHILKHFQDSICIKKPSYDSKKREQMILNYAKKEGCKWLEVESLRKKMIELVSDVENLPTPLSIRQFTIATKNSMNEEELVEITKAKSIETVISFSKELKQMNEDRLLFLMFPFISPVFSPTFIEEKYTEIVDDLNIEGAMGFSSLFKWFEKDKITIANDFVVFSHPSYYAAFEHVLFENNSNARIQKILQKVIENLFVTDPWDVANIIVSMYPKLPSNMQQYLPKLLEKAPKYLAMAMVRHFNTIPQKIKDELIIKLGDREDSVWAVVDSLMYNYRSLSIVQIEMLYSLAEKQPKATVVALEMNFRTLPEDARLKLLEILHPFDETTESISLILSDNFDSITEELRNKLVKTICERNKSNADIHSIFGLASNYNKLPEDIKEIFLTLCRRNPFAAIMAIGPLFDSVQNEVQQLFISLSEKEPIRFITTIDSNFNKIPKEIREDLILELAKDDKCIAAVSVYIIYHYRELGTPLREQIFRMVDKNPVRISMALKAHFNEIPEGIREKLLNLLSKYPNAFSIVALIIDEYFNTISKETREGILSMLAKDEDNLLMRWAVCLAIKNNQDQLSSEIVAFLPDLEKDFEKSKEEYLAEKRKNRK